MPNTIRVDHIDLDRFCRDALRAWMDEVLFTPTGIRTAEPTFDDAGTFVGSSYLHMTARDWARYGLLNLRGGEWDGTQVLPRAWVEDGRRAWAVDDDGSHYGTHWWVHEDGRGTFFCSGFEIQRVICVPMSDLVVVRLGHYSGVEASQDSLSNALAALMEAVPER